MAYMKKRTRIFLSTLILATLAGVALAAYFSRRSEITTRSEKAREAFLRGEENLRRFYWNDAKLDFAEALENDPNFALALIGLAQLAGRQGELERAKNLIDRAHQLEDQVTQTEKYKIEMAFAGMNGNEDETERLGNEYLKNFPNDKWIVAHQASSIWRKGKTDEAVRLYQHLLEIAPNSADAYNQLGYIAAKSGEFARAEEYFKKYAFIASRQANPYDSLGELFLHTGRYDEAETSSRKALEIRPDFDTSTVNLALVRRKQGRTDEAFAILNESIPRFGDVSLARRARILLGVLNLEQGRWDEAERAFATLEKTSSEKKFAAIFEILQKTLKARVSLGKGNPGLAESETRDARIRFEELKTSGQKSDKIGKDEIDGIDGAIRGVEAEIAAARGDHSTAVSEFRKIEKAFKGLPFGEDGLSFIFLFRTRISVAESLVKLGRFGEARDELAKNLAIDPRDPFTLEARLRLGLEP